MYSKNRKSQTLIEVVLAMALAVIVVVAIVILTNVTLRNSKSALRRSEAAKLANAGIEAVRYAKDASGASCGYSTLTAGCYQLSNGGPICGALDSALCTGVSINLDGELYTRIIDIADNGTTKLVTVTVKWPEATGSRTEQSVEIQTIISDTRVN